MKEVKDRARAMKEMKKESRPSVKDKPSKKVAEVSRDMKKVSGPKGTTKNHGDKMPGADQRGGTKRAKKSQDFF